MNRFRWSFVFICLLLSALSAAAQVYPYPGKGTPVPCSGCGGSNEGKPTYAFNDPLLAHAGRYVDSWATGNVQNAGMRTVRARVTRIAPERNRIYIALGETIGAYTLDQFFTTSLRQPMVPVNTIPVNTSTSWTRYGSPYEKLSRPESIFYAEAVDSGWQTYLQDMQRVLADFDVDDRGYVYIGTWGFGWGIARDTGATDGRHMEFVAQEAEAPVASDVVLALKSGTSYHAVVSSNTRGAERTIVYDVTVPATPQAQPVRSGNQHGIVVWARNDAAQRLAVINSDGHLRIYDYATYVASGAPLADYAPAAGKRFSHAAFDVSGAVWVAIGSTSGITSNTLMKVAPAANGYASESFDVYGALFNATHISAAAGYIAVIGNGAGSRELRLLELVNGIPRLVQTGDFFRNYYEVVPEGYADPGFTTGGNHVRVVEQGAKTYLMYSAEGLGDVYVLDRRTTPQIATSISLTSTAGDPVTLTATVTPQSAGAVAPKGVVTFAKNGAALATAALAPFENVWRATLTRKDLGTGALTASFEGDDLYLPSGPATIGSDSALPAPAGVNATASAARSVVLTWQPVAGATAYRVFRSPNVNTVFAQIAEVSGNVHTDLDVAANTTYLYRVAALDGTREGATSAIEVATTVAFTDDPLVHGATIRLAHVTELRTAVNAMRAAAALPATTFTDPVLDAGSPVKAAHVTELRTACDEARAALGLGGIGISSITPQFTNVRRDDFVNLRVAVE